MVSTNLRRNNFPHIPRIGEKFNYEGQRYTVTSIPTFSSIVGENVKPASGEFSSVKITANQAEWF